jgi:hypothetical protein
MTRRALIPLLGLALLGSAALPAAAAAAPPSAAWRLAVTPMPSNLAPGTDVEYLLVATNVGGAATEGPFEVSAELPEEVIPTEEPVAKNLDPLATEDPECQVLAQHLSCATAGAPDEALGPGWLVKVTIYAHVQAGASGEAGIQASAQGGGGKEVSASASSPISAQAVPFGFAEALSAPALQAEGEAATLAGSHPFQMSIGLGFPTKLVGAELIGTEHPRDIRADLPRGLLGDPAATSALCTEAELTSEASEEEGGCPEGSQVGMVVLTTLLAGAESGGNGKAINTVYNLALYNMVPPPGAPAELAFNAAEAGIFVHLLAHLQNGSDYHAYTTSNDILALGAHPVFSVQTQIWGDPSAGVYDRIRGECQGTGSHYNPTTKEFEPCPVDPRETPFLTMPGDCPGSPLRFEAFADSWEHPATIRESSYESADLQGESVAMQGCGALPYEPQIQARPTTLGTDSPTGLDFALHQPQQGPEAQPLAGRATATLKDATVAFPPGMTVNPSQATGLEACAESEIGYEGQGKAGEPLFSGSPQGCPEASKIATLSAASPLLAQYDEANHTPLRDPETNETIPRTLAGSVYLAKPFANPFDSLIATYLAIEDPKTGIIAKLAGEGRLDPATGQLSVRFPQSPELPIEDVQVSVFGGDRGALISPPTCVSQQTTSGLVPWSAPEGPTAHPTDAFTPTSAPGGGPCPSTEADMPNAPAFSAGTSPPQAGKYATLLFHLARPDGSQRFSRIDTTLPSGLLARLAGVAQCSDADLAKAKSREAPNKGATELADPSCPAASELGTVKVAAGAGPHPYITTGRAYLAGPYEGAPLSAAIIAPAIAGPFDLGTVVTRVALHLEPGTATARAVSDPVPQLIDGVPLDLRSVALRIDRPGFALNPTSCDPKSFSGTETSALGSQAPLSERFQVGGCRQLPYKPKLSARLFGPTHRGAHPRLRAIFTAKPGEANTARVSFTFPHSEFIDQAHFRTICTRVQFAAGACPKGSVYGHVRVRTPLVDYPLSGPAYLRSSSHELPDIVVALHGPSYQPIEIDAVGRVDSVRGGLRVRFQGVPDAPLTKLVFNAQGARKGLFQNSTNLCKGTHRIDLRLLGQNAKAHDTRPKLKASCHRHKRKRHRGHRHRGSRR